MELEKLQDVMRIFVIIIAFLFGLITFIPALLVLAILRIRAWLIVRSATAEGLIFCDGLDAAWAHDPHLIITTQFGLSGVLDLTTVREAMRENIENTRDTNGDFLFRKLRQKIQKRKGLLFWKNVHHLDIDFHVVLHDGVHPSTEQEMCNLLSELHSQKMNYDMPCWRVIIVPTQGHLLSSGIPCYLVYRFHHAIADGISFFRTFSYLFSKYSTDNEAGITLHKFSATKAERSTTVKLCRNILTMMSVNYVSFKMLFYRRNILYGPQRTKTTLILSASFDLPKIKAIKNATKCTVNDVLMAALAGTLRRYFIYKNSNVPNYFGVLIPISFTKPNDPLALENNFSFGIVHLPLHVENSYLRLKTTIVALKEMKRSPDILVHYWMLKHVVKFLPPGLFEYFVNRHGPVQAIATNASGTNEKLECFGNEVVDMISPVAFRGLTGVGFAFFGNRGKLCATITIDKAIINNRNDMEKMGQFFSEELQDLYEEIFDNII